MNIPRKLKILLSDFDGFEVTPEKRHFIVKNPVNNKTYNVPAICDWKTWEEVKTQLRSLRH